MPPRFAYWTIILDGTATSFRAREQEELLPTFNRLKKKDPTAIMKWFSGGTLWDSPEQAKEHRRQERERQFGETRPRDERPREERPWGGRTHAPRSFAARPHEDRPAGDRLLQRRPAPAAEPEPATPRRTPRVLPRLPSAKRKA